MLSAYSEDLMLNLHTDLRHTVTTGYSDSCSKVLHVRRSSPKTRDVSQLDTTLNLSLLCHVRPSEEQNEVYCIFTVCCNHNFFNTEMHLLSDGSIKHILGYE